jgi:ABC-2 type transport system ATP-binding protein
MTSPASPVIEADGLTKRYGRATVVDQASFQIRGGAVTGFFGPNGAGKTTVLKLLTGLSRPTSGAVLINGTAQPELNAHSIGVYIEPCGAHPGRSGQAHLLALARIAGLPRQRVGQVLDEVGLASAARRRVGGYSLGMRQRLGLAAALLGDPPLLVLDEPVNGLDPAGMRWLRNLLHERASQGGTVLLSSHVLSEADKTVDDVVVIDHGRILHQGPAQGSLEDLFFDVVEGNQK